MFTRISLALAALLTLATPVLAEKAPDNVDGATTVSITEAVALFDEGAVFVDVRKPSDFDAGRVPGAVNLYLREALTEDALISEVGKDETVVFYCNGVKCDMSSQACAKAVSWGFKQVHYMREGFPGWEAAGLPVE